MKDLKSFIEEAGKEAEYDSLKNTPDNEYRPRASAFAMARAELDRVIEILDAVLVLEEDGTYKVKIKNGSLPEDNNITE